ncbi:hypothetical protein ANN_07689 [Periplaneta americana]|uniref:Uncharacterized protein n=1 Tax=Periplaneta americana TaxID=6978 RepID=A0ABQ8T0W6_PERAM|nr:hypothetical protein ANN_07689 [Periplaneta americana]
MGESRNAYSVLVGRPEGKRPLGRPRRRWEDDIKIDLREVGYDDRDWINLAQDRDQWRAYVRAAMNLRLTSGRRLKNAYFWRINTSHSARLGLAVATKESICNTPAPMARIPQFPALNSSEDDSSSECLNSIHLP